VIEQLFTSELARLVEDHDELAQVVRRTPDVGHHHVQRVGQLHRTPETDNFVEPLKEPTVGGETAQVGEASASPRTNGSLVDARKLKSFHVGRVGGVGGVGGVEQALVVSNVFLDIAFRNGG
jgi:hypothetical protein